MVFVFFLKDETVFFTSDLEVVKIEKNIKKKEKNDIEVDKDDQDDLLKGLTFNVHLSSDDLEAKRNLVLPYEILGYKITFGFFLLLKLLFNKPCLKL